MSEGLLIAILFILTAACPPLGALFLLIIILCGK